MNIVALSERGMIGEKKILFRIAMPNERIKVLR
jgi:hypothetical protein